jgi:glycosyltransferase involved in cell wall biosynthesis
LKNFNADAFKVSVIIPVYNAATYVRQAVESALVQAETGEVILIEDGSPDGALTICQELSAQYPQVRLFQHPNGENRGAGASRNLGMRVARFPWLAFLDADDYFLPNRFVADSQVIASHPECGGVYNAVEMHVENPEARERWDAAGKSPNHIQAVTEEIPPEKLAEALLDGSAGYFHIDAFTLNKAVLAESGLMREDLRLHQDTEFILRTAMCASLLPASRTEPVARWRVHAQNRISAPRSQVRKLDDRLRMWETLDGWCKQEGKSRYRSIIMNAMAGNVINLARFGGAIDNRFKRRVLRLWFLVKWLIVRLHYWADPVLWHALRLQAGLGKGLVNQSVRSEKELS